MKFLCGLPRSRTYWFAAYFNGISGVQAIHEPLNGLESREQFYRLVEEHPETIFIDSGLYLTDWQARWPDARSVIVHRPLPDVLASLQRLGIDPNAVEAEMQLAQDIYTLSRGKHVKYDDVNDRLQEIHEFLTDEPFENIHAKRMIDAHLVLSEITGNPDSFRIWKER